MSCTKNKRKLNPMIRQEENQQQLRKIRYLKSVKNIFNIVCYSSLLFIMGRKEIAGVYSDKGIG